MNDSVHLRNAKALDARNKQQQGEIDGLLLRIVSLEQQLVMLRARVDAQEQRVMTLLATRGHGPTQR